MKEYVTLYSRPSFAVISTGEVPGLAIRNTIKNANEISKSVTNPNFVLAAFHCFGYRCWLSSGDGFCFARNTTPARTILLTSRVCLVEETRPTILGLRLTMQERNPYIYVITSTHVLSHLFLIRISEAGTAASLSVVRFV